MYQYEQDTPGLSLLVDLNWDRLFFSAAIAGSLALSVALGGVLF